MHFFLTLNQGLYLKKMKE